MKMPWIIAVLGLSAAILLSTGCAKQEAGGSSSSHASTVAGLRALLFVEGTIWDRRESIDLNCVLVSESNRPITIDRRLDLGLPS